MIKETREQYLARKKEQLERRLAWQKRRDERAAERKKQAMEEAVAAYNSTQHLSGKDLKSIMSTDLVKRCLEELVFGTKNKDFEALVKELVRRTTKRAKKDSVTYTPPNMSSNGWVNSLKKEDIMSTYAIICGRTTKTFDEDFKLLHETMTKSQEWIKTLEKDPITGSLKSMPDWPENIVNPILEHWKSVWGSQDVTIGPATPSEERFWNSFGEMTKLARSFFSMLRKKYVLDWEEIKNGKTFYSGIAI